MHPFTPIRNNILRTLMAGLYISLCWASANATIYTVTNTNNSGSGSLRQAITDANGGPGLDTIRFNISTGGGNTFEGTAPNRYAVITVTSALPTITAPLFINGSSQPVTNIGFLAGKYTGADNNLQPNIPYPNVYIVPNYTLPNSTNNVSGNGLSINSINVTITGLAISGFGNRITSGGSASAHADISVLRSSSSRVTNISIYNCFLSSDPLGNYPSTTARRTKGNSILICGNNFSGRIASNLIAHSGTYGLHFNGMTDNLSVGASTVYPNQSWTIENNQFYYLTRNSAITSEQVSDAINTMKCSYFRILNNHIEDIEQVAIDLGYNADNNYVENNTITGLNRSSAILPQAGIRIGLSSQYDTLMKNVIFNNTGSRFRAGIWIDRSSVSTTGIVVRNNENNLIQENIIYNNSSSGIVLSNFGGSVNAINNKISRNSTYHNTGLGIDLDFGGTSSVAAVSTTAVTVNDNTDSDNGTNNLQNFPLIDSARITGAGIVTIWGKSAAGATIEFFGGDGQTNNHGGRTLSYGEGRYYIGTGIEGSGADGATGTNASYSFDGNVAVSNLNLFRFSFTYGAGFGSLDSLTSTATVANNTSEFGPVVIPDIVLGCTLLDLNLLYADNTSVLRWSAICDTKFNQFVIEKSTNGQNFQTLGSVYAPKTGEEIQLDFTDRFPEKGNSYYRLKMLNTDGSFTYSKVLRLHTGSINTVKVLPNPFVSEINVVQNLDRDGLVEMRIADLSGRVWITRSVKAYKGVNNLSIQGIDHLARGMYILEISVNGQTVREKISKQ